MIGFRVSCDSITSLIRRNKKGYYDRWGKSLRDWDSSWQKAKILKVPVTRMSSYVNNLENIVATWYIIKTSKCWPLEIKLAENDIQNWLYSDWLPILRFLIFCSAKETWRRASPRSGAVGWDSERFVPPQPTFRHQALSKFAIKKMNKW